jgi:hypothetical protein
MRKRLQEACTKQSDGQMLLPFMQAVFCVRRYIVLGFSVSHISARNVLFVEVVHVFMVNAECCSFLDRFVTKIV